MTARDFILKFKNTYDNHYCHAYIPVWSKEGKIMATLSKKINDDIVMLRAIEMFLAHSSEYWGVASHSTFTFSKCINSILRALSDQHDTNPHLGRFNNAKEL